MRTNSSQHGFTLIELMIVVAIIAILAAIAIPAYQNYLVRAEVSEGLSLDTAAKTAVWEYVANHGVYPTDNKQAGVSAATSITGKYVSEVNVVNGQIVATFNTTTANSNIQRATLVLSPATTAGAIQWTCTPSTVKSQYLPSSCRG